MKSLPVPYPEVPRQPERPQPLPMEHGYDDDDAAGLWVYFDTLWNKRRLLVGISLAAGLATAVVSLLLPRQYSAEATIFLTPPTYSTTLRPEIMSVEAYAKLAESDYVLTIAEAEMRRTRPDLFDHQQTNGRLVNYVAKLSASREPQKPYLPLIGLGADSDSPEKAKIAANTWADIFVKQEGKFSEIGKSKSANFILAEYPKVEKALADSEETLQTLQKRHAEDLASLKTQVGVSLKKAQLESAEFTVVSLENGLSTARTDSDRLKPSVAELEKEVKVTPPYLIVSKAITDDALWTAQSQAQARGVDAVANAKLQSQEPNPVYTSLSQRLAKERVDVNALGPQIDSLQKQIEGMRKEAAAMRAALLDSERRVADMERLHALEEAGLKRAIETSKKSFDDLADKIGEARIAQSEPDTDLKLGAYAELPTKPSGPRRLVIVGGAAVFAFIITAILVLGSAVLRAHQQHRRLGSDELAASRR